jgi:hypothetical protein
MIQSLTSIFNYQTQTKAQAFPFVARLYIDTNVDKRRQKREREREKEDAALLPDQRFNG